VNSETRLRIAVEAANLGIWDWDLLTNEMTWSGNARGIAGFPADRPVTFEDVRNVTCPDDLPRTSAMARRALDPAVRSKEPYEYRLLRRDGTIRWVLAHGEAVFADVDGRAQAIRYTGTIQDITSRKEAETRLSESEAHLRLAIDAARLGVWEYDAATETIKSSPGLNRVLGIPENKHGTRPESGSESGVWVKLPSLRGSAISKWSFGSSRWMERYVGSCSGPISCFRQMVSPRVPSGS
jgi:PAS domain S-box-containing protein